VNQYQVYSTVPEYSITQYQKSAAYKFHSLLDFTTATEPQYNQNHVCNAVHNCQHITKLNSNCNHRYYDNTVNTTDTAL